MNAKEKLLQMDIKKATEVVKSGGIIAYPTEAVWGLGCDPWNQLAVNRILAIKQRPVEKGLILVGATEDQFLPLLTPLSPKEKLQLQSTWPGPYTWLIPDPLGWAPPWVRGRFDTVAVRVSAHPLVRALCEAAGHPLVSTSANLAGNEPLLTISEVSTTFAGELDYIVTGTTGEQKTPSTIQDLRSGKLVRAG